MEWRHGGEVVTNFQSYIAVISSESRKHNRPYCPNARTYSAGRFSGSRLLSLAIEVTIYIRHEVAPSGS